CLDVAGTLVRNSEVGADDGVDFRFQPSALEKFYRRESQPLLLGCGGVCGKAARHGAAYIRPVTSIGKPAEDLPGAIDRHYEAHVHQVRAAKIGVVDDIDVVFFRRLAAAVPDHFDHGAGRILHDADEYRQSLVALGDQRTVVCRIHAIVAVIGFVDYRREGGAGEGEVHLVARLLQCCLYDGKGKRIQGGLCCPVLPAHLQTSMMILPSASDRARSPGSSTVVASICSRMAGPSITASRGNPSRA